MTDDETLEKMGFIISEFGVWTKRDRFKAGVEGAIEARIWLEDILERPGDLQLLNDNHKTDVINALGDIAKFLGEE